MKNIKKIVTLVLFISILCVGMISCENENLLNYSEIGFDCLPDPEGTKISTCTSWGRKSDYESMETDATGTIRCDDNNIMYSSQYDFGENGMFYIVGRVAGLAAIKSIPTDENVWQDEVSVVPGYGYILRCKNNQTQQYVYCRLYCIYSEGAVGGQGGRIVNVFKHQSPFIP